MGRTTVYNNIVDDIKWNAVNKENKELLNEWVEYLNSVDRSNETISQYINDAKIFFCWVSENANNKFFVEINKRDIMKFQNYLLNILKQSPSRIRRLKSCISSLANYIESMLDDIYPSFRNIVNKIPAPAKEVVRDKTVLEEEQVNFLLKYLVKKKITNVLVYSL
jgi:site-specific recombinase XerD